MSWLKALKAALHDIQFCTAMLQGSKIFKEKEFFEIWETCWLTFWNKWELSN